eukprot:487591_1
MLEDSKKMTPHEDRYCLSDSQRNRKYSTRPKAEKCIYSLCALAFLTAKTLHLKNVYIQRTNFRCDPMESIQRSERTNCDGSSHYKDLMRWEIRTKFKDDIEEYIALQYAFKPSIYWTTWMRKVLPDSKAMHQ